MSVSSKPKKNRQSMMSGCRSYNGRNNHKTNDAVVVLNAVPVATSPDEDEDLKNRKNSGIEPLRPYNLLGLIPLLLFMMALGIPFLKHSISPLPKTDNPNNQIHHHLIDINEAHHSRGKTLLLAAIDIGSIKVVKALLDNGADINGRDTKSGRTPLIQAVLNGNLKMCKLLIDKGADVNAKDHLDTTALLLAVHRDDFELVKLLINNGASIHSHGNSSEKSQPNEAAAKSGIQTLGNMGVNIKDDNGSTALQVAAARGSVKIINLLLDNCANTNVQ